MTTFALTSVARWGAPASVLEPAHRAASAPMLGRSITPAPSFEIEVVARIDDELGSHVAVFDERRWAMAEYRQVLLCEGATIVDVVAVPEVRDLTFTRDGATIVAAPSSVDWASRAVSPHVAASLDDELTARARWSAPERVSGLGYHACPVTRVTFAPGGTCFASADVAGCVALWPRGGRSPIAAWRAHDGAVRGMAWHPGGLLVTGGADGELRAWLGGELVSRRSLEGPIHTLAFDATGTWLALAIDARPIPRLVLARVL